MASTSIGSQKFASLEIVDSAKFDNEIVFDTLSMIGTDLSMVVEEDITLSSTNTTGNGGVNILSGMDIHLMCTTDNSTVWLLGGVESTTSPVTGNVVIGHSSDTMNPPTPTITSAFDGTNRQIGLFDASPVVQQTTIIPSAVYSSVGGSAVSTLDTFDGYTIGQVVAAMRNYGMLA